VYCVCPYGQHVTPGFVPVTPIRKVDDWIDAGRAIRRAPASATRPDREHQHATTTENVPGSYRLTPKSSVSITPHQRRRHQQAEADAGKGVASALDDDHPEQAP
jgi:hypothetical protein